MPAAQGATASTDESAAYVLGAWEGRAGGTHLEIQEKSMSKTLIALSALAVAGTLSFGAIDRANAQPYGNDVTAKCAQSVGAMKFEGWPADRNKDMMMLACQNNGGIIPGAREESPVSLPQHHPARRH
jgi:hypothetical protein